MKTISIKLLLLISILFIALGCEKDDAIREGENSSEIQEVLSKTLNLEDIPNYGKVKKKLQKLDKDLNSGANSLFKNLDTDEVQILTDDIIYMTYAETHTYTFKLLRNTPQYYIENIVLHYNVETFSYDEYLVQYDVDGQEFIQINQGSSLGDDVDVLITELKEGTLNSFLGKSSCFRVCETVFVNCTAGDNHPYGDPECCAVTGECSSDYAASTFQSCGPVCIDTNPNPPETIDDGGNTGGGGSTPGDDNVLTNPNPNEPCETSNGSTGITGGDGCITTVDEIERSNLLISIGGRLSISERNWVNNQAPLNQIIQINQFIDGLSWRDLNEGKDFAVEVVKELIENPEAEVDFDDIIINELTGKAFTVYNNFKNTSSSFKELISNFDGNFPVSHLRFVINDNLPSGNYGRTRPPSNYLITIEMSNVQLNNISELGAAVAFVHEVIHAEIFRKMLSAAQTGDLDPANMTQEQQVNYVESLRENFPGIYDYYIERYRPTWNHNMMAEHYIDVIANAIEEFDDFQKPRQVYEDLAWVGLRVLEDMNNSIAWDNLSEETQSRILNNFNLYFFN